MSVRLTREAKLLATAASLSQTPLDDHASASTNGRTTCTSPAGTAPSTGTPSAKSVLTGCGRSRTSTATTPRTQTYGKPSKTHARKPPDALRLRTKNQHLARHRQQPNTQPAPRQLVPTRRLPPTRRGRHHLPRTPTRHGAHLSGLPRNARNSRRRRPDQIAVNTYYCPTCGIVWASDQPPICRHGVIDSPIPPARMVPLPSWHPFAKP
jgi:hypothetical protein